MYYPQGFYVPNAINRFHLAAWMLLKYNPDGPLEIYIQASSPGGDKESNWLPAPKSGPFSLTVRDYWPTEAVLDGTYKLPPVKKVPGKPRRHAMGHAGLLEHRGPEPDVRGSPNAR